MKWRVTLRPVIEGAPGRRELLGEHMRGALTRYFSRLESEVTVTDAGLELVLEPIVAASEKEARRKGQYCCRRAAESRRGISWHHQPNERIEVCPLG